MIVFADASLAGVTEDGLMQLAVNCLRPGIGMAGGKIISEAGEVLYGRMELDSEGELVYADADLPKGFTGFFHKSILQQNTEGVSYRLFAVRKELISQWKPQMEGTDEAMMQQLCAFVKLSGYRITYVPSATAALKREG